VPVDFFFASARLALGHLAEQILDAIRAPS
jgi:hypothetical protein